MPVLTAEDRKELERLNDLLQKAVKKEEDLKKEIRKIIYKIEAR